MTARNIVVCIKVVPKTENVSFDPVTKTLDRSKAENELNQADKNAVELALRLREKNGGRVILLSMGPPFFEPFLKLGVAMGADDAILLSDRAFGGSDTFTTSYVLAAGIKKIGNVDLVLCGEESADASTGQVPAGIAEWLGIPQITFASDLEILPDGRLKGKRTIRGGYEFVAVPLPALAAVELGVNTPRFPDFRRKRWADKEFKVTVWSAKDLEVDEHFLGKVGSHTTVQELVEAKAPNRKRQYLEGTTEEKAKLLLKTIAPLISS